MIGIFLALSLLTPAPLVAGSALQASEAREDERAAVAELAAMDSARLALMLLEDPAASATIVAHVAEPPFPMRPPVPPGQLPAVGFVRLFTEAAPTPEGVCLRQAYGAEVRRIANGSGFEPTHSRARPYPEIRLDADCGAARERRFASLNQIPVAEAATMMRRLAGIQLAARRGLPLGVEVQCSSELRPDPCGVGERELVKRLPLDGAYHFQRGYDASRRLELAMTATRPGEVYWRVSFLDDGPRPVLRLIWQVPAPF